MNLRNINSISQTFTRFIEDDDYIYDIVNKTPRNILNKLYEHYSRKSLNFNVDKVVKARAVVLGKLLKRNKLNSNTIEHIKSKIVKEAKSKHYYKNIFHSWKPNWRILYPIFYNRYREGVRSTLNELAYRFMYELNLENIALIKVEDFNGPQNFGTPSCWFAIYNNTHYTQKTAYQLYFYLNNGWVSYGLYKYKDEVASKFNKCKLREYKYENVLNCFKKFIYKIEKDINPLRKKYKKIRRKGKLIVNVNDYFRKTIKSTKVKQIHKNIQNILSESLRNIYHNEATVKLEEDFIDIKVESKNFIHIYEIKTNNKAINCVREAIGQLLLYASRLINPHNKKIELVVVGLGEDNLDVKEFRKYLLDNFNFHFRYQYSQGSFN